jgi:hypothetical protein
MRKTKREALEERLKKAVPKEKLVETTRTFDTGVRYKKETWRTRTAIVARNSKTGRFIGWRTLDPRLSIRQNINVLKDRVFEMYEEKNFQKARKKIPDDGTGLRVKKKDPESTMSTYFAVFIMIIQFEKGFSPIVRYRISSNEDNRLVAIKNQTTKVPFQARISTLKDIIIKDTGVSLEEWILLSRATGKIKVQGRITYKLFENPKFKKPELRSQKIIHLDKI